MDRGMVFIFLWWYKWIHICVPQGLSQHNINAQSFIKHFQITPGLRFQEWWYLLSAIKLWWERLSSICVWKLLPAILGKDPMKCYGNNVIDCLQYLENIQYWFVATFSLSSGDGFTSTKNKITQVQTRY